MAQAEAPRSKGVPQGPEALESPTPSTFEKLWPLTAGARETVKPPAFLSIVRDVTNDPSYKNKTLATRGLPRS